MTAKYWMSKMNHSADARYAPACQSATMTMTTDCAITLDTAVWAVSFLFESLLGIVSGAVRIILPWTAKP